MRNYLSIFFIPVLASCTTMQSAKSVEVSEVITADLARADGSWAGVIACSAFWSSAVSACALPSQSRCAANSCSASGKKGPAPLQRASSAAGMSRPFSRKVRKVRKSYSYITRPGYLRSL